METRHRNGTISIIVALLALSVMSIGFFSIEIWFAQLAMCQLQNCADAASIGAAASMVSARDPLPGPDGQPGPIDDAYKVKTRLTAKEAALKIVTKSSVIGHSLEHARIVNDASLTTDLKEGETAISVRFLDQKGRESPSGKHIVIDAATAVKPMSGKLFGLDSYIVRVKGTSAAAKLDLAFCLDDSGSMATDTPISMVHRGWNGATAIQHLPHFNGIAKTYGTMGMPEPMLIGVYSHEKKTFDAGARGSNGDVGTPPGPGAKGEIIPPATTTTMFTDRIVNIDGKQTFTGCTKEGLSFPDVATLVEASRGNLDNTEVFTRSLANTVVPAGIEPNSHYKEVYERAALKKVEPFNSAKVEIKRFFDLLEANTDSHFALIPFSARAARTEEDTLQDWPVGEIYSKRPKAFFNFHKVGFNVTSSRYENVKTKIDTYRLHGGTATPNAIEQAIQTFEQNSRPDARRVILVFTDGEPTAANGHDAIQDSIDAAAKAKPKGITIFAIGFLHDGYRPDAVRCLKGVAEAGAPGGRYFVVQEVEGLHEIFRLISRQLVTLE